MATLDARLQPMPFISVGDPQSMLTTAIGVSPSTGFGGKEQTMF